MCVCVRSIVCRKEGGEGGWGNEIGGAEKDTHAYEYGYSNEREEGGEGLKDPSQLM